MKTFVDLGLDLWLQELLTQKAITVPTAVQLQAIPSLLQERNNRSLFFIESETGTGKTFAFLLPSLQRLDFSCVQPQIIIAAPTKELASQLKTEADYFAKLHAPQFKTALLIGDAPIKRQLEILKTKPVIICGTTGRLLELIRLKKIKTQNVTVLILDETDRMLAPEMRDDIGELSASLPCCKKIVCCSATMKDSYIDIITNFYKKPDEPLEIVTLKLPQEDVLRKRITHWAFFAEQRDKISVLRSFLHAEQPEKTLVFTAQAGQVANIVSQLMLKKITAIAGLHAKMDKVVRKQTIDNFRNGKIKILVTSDITARGLDIPGVSHIIQLDIPSDYDFFVHRAGRTGRAGKCGINAVIGTAYEMRLLERIEKKLKLTVYPKIIYNGKILAPDDDTTKQSAPELRESSGAAIN